jgi:hypothetical protein
MTTLGSLEKTLQDYQKKIDKRVSEICQKVANTVLESVVLNTPVDTSQALSNWQVTFLKPSAGTRTAYYVGSRGSTEAESASQTLAVGRNRIKLKSKGESLFISNQLDYILKLEYGNRFSKPGMFAAKAVQKGLEVLAKEKI